MKYVDSLNIEKFVGSDDLIVEFGFKENPYFENEFLRITFSIDESSDFDCGIIETKSEQIDWKPQKNFLLKKLKNDKNKK